MEILDKSEAHLANTEVLAFLREQRQLMTSSQKSGRTQRFLSGSVATIMLETLTSLESSNNGAIANIDEASVRDFLSEIEEFNLTDTEKIVLLNHCPTTQVEIHLLIENSEERLQEEQLESILAIVKRVLLKQEESEENGDEEEEGEDDEKEENDVEGGDDDDNE